MPLPVRFTLALLALAPALRAAENSSAPGPPPITLDALVVTDSLDKAREDIVPALGATSYQIDAAQIDVQSLGANGGFDQVLLRTPSMAQDSFGQVHLRGEHANLQYRVNDVLLPEGIAGFSQELDIPFVKTVSILTGSLPAQYGYRTAGVVDIHTQSGTALKNQGDIDIFAGSFDTLRVSAESSGIQGGLTDFFTASAESNALGIENPTASRTALHDRSQQVKTFGDLSDVLNSKSRVSLLFGSSSATFQIPDNPGQAPAYIDGSQNFFDSARLNENQSEYNDYAIAAYQRSTEDFSGQVSAFTRYSLTHFTPDVVGDLIFNGVAADVHQDIVSNGLEADGKWSLPSGHTLRAGALVISTNANTKTNTAVFAVDGGGQQASTVPVWIQDDHHKLGWLYGVYLQDEWKPLDRLTLNYGLRADESVEFLREGQVSPRLNLVYRFNSALSAHAGYARYFTPPPLELAQTPTLAKFTGTTNQPAVAADSPIRSERADYYDAGLTWQITEDFSVTADGYDKRATNQIDEGQFGAALIFSTFNYQIGRVYGAEVSANYNHGPFSIYANVAPGRAYGENLTSGQFQFDAAELAYIATHEVHLDHDQALTASGGLAYRFTAATVFGDFLYGSGLRSGFANTDHVPEYHPLNAGAEHTFTLGDRRKLTLRLDLTNLLDESYELRDGSGIGVFAPQ